jgi:hypothetical protein
VILLSVFKLWDDFLNDFLHPIQVPVIQFP